MHNENDDLNNDQFPPKTEDEFVILNDHRIKKASINEDVLVMKEILT
jgi:hypothetical protein